MVFRQLISQLAGGNSASRLLQAGHQRLSNTSVWTGGEDGGLEFLCLQCQLRSRLGQDSCTVMVRLFFIIYSSVNTSEASGLEFNIPSGNRDIRLVWPLVSLTQRCPSPNIVPRRAISIL